MAGDQLKAASDLGVPVVGIGFFINRDTFVRKLIKMEINRLFTRIMIRDNCLLFLCVHRMENGYDLKLNCLVILYGYVPGRFRLAE